MTFTRRAFLALVPLAGVRLAQTCAHNVADFGTPADKETAVQGAIDAARRSTCRIVFVPQAFFGYDASRVRFDRTVHMTREGHVTQAKDVVAYGALSAPDHDSTAAIRAACDAVTSEAPRVYFPDGVFTISDEIRLRRSPITLVGTGATVRQRTAGRKIIWARGQSNVGLDGLRIEGTIGQGIFEAHAVYFEGCQRTTLRNCTVANAEQDAIKIGSDGAVSRDHTIVGCQILDFGGQGVLVGADPRGHVENLLIRDTTIRKTTAITYDRAFAGHSIYLDRVRNAEIAHCAFEAVLTNGVQLEGGTGITVTDCTFDGAAVEGRSVHGLACSGSNCTFTRLTISGFGGAGVRIAGGASVALSSSTIEGSRSHDVVLLTSHNSTVSDCTLGSGTIEDSDRIQWLRNTHGGGGFPSFRVTRSRDVRVVGGTVTGMGQQGVRAEACERLLLQDLSILDNGTAAGAGRGIGVYLVASGTPCSDCVVSGCTICDSGVGVQGFAYVDEGLRNTIERTRYKGALTVAATGISRENDRVATCPTDVVEMGTCRPTA